MALTFRHQEIVALARAEGRVTVEGLAERFRVTRQTIRRDLSDLCEAGLLSRVHGGALLPSGISNFGYGARQAMAREAKYAIGRLCAAEIPNDSSLIVNIGTTTEAVARALLGHRDLLAITNNLNVARILGGNDSFEVLVAGGAYRRADDAVVGGATVAFIEQFRVDYAIVGASALDTDGTLLDFDHREAQVTQAILASARQTFLVADASKFTRSAPVRIATADRLSAVFTDAAPPPAFAEMCARAGVRIAVVGQEQSVSAAHRAAE